MKKVDINVKLQDIMGWLGISTMDYFFIVPKHIAPKYTAPVPFKLRPATKEAALQKKKKKFGELNQQELAVLKTFNARQTKLASALSKTVVQWVIGV
jgi:hypothetical protein